MTEDTLKAIGGYFYNINDQKVFPGVAEMKRENVGLNGTWREQKREVDPQRQKAGFMPAEVPWPWINCL